ncbi:MAG: beta-ketoacyl-[acyl-carrier-protein] synthase family protein [Verrucomicrobia bacterium]|nr:beta-ketoacyl-[acyl-carrier-protein] synthase family protein [Verrucomicrobiota bacterium]MBV9273888.1 beta-ketoacyl-[acyl-carrier-protein] synthase family protein [Verrucomicrobiota bacterium]
MQRVLITGFGIVSPLGRDGAENLKSLWNGSDCISPVNVFDVSKSRCRTAGQVQNTWLAKPKTRRQRRLDRSSLMMIQAVREMMRTSSQIKPETLVVATSSGAMSKGEQFYRSLVTGKNRAGAARQVANYLPQKPVLDVQEEFNWRVPAHIISNACASGTNAVGHAFHLVRAECHDVVLCGGYDPLSEMVFTGFDSLQAATSEKIRPFDRDRSGLVLGEGAAVLLLESERSAVARHVTVFGEIVGYGVSTDNYHPTQPHPSGIGPRLAMQRALADAGLDAGQIDYVNAHGTATIFNDATEGIAISELMPGAAVSSTKSMMGHALGGAGAIEAVFSLLAIMHQLIPPNINFRQPEPGWKFRVVGNKAEPAKIRRVISNSFGFGGLNASLILQAA